MIAILAQFLDSPQSMYEITANFLDSKAFSAVGKPSYMKPFIESKLYQLLT